MKKTVIFFLLFFSFSFYGQKDTISIIRHTDNDLIIPKNIKVVFRGDEILIYDFKYQIKPNFTGFICKITNIVISII